MPSFLSKKKRPLQISRLIALIFLCIILLGAGLLTLPFASRSGSSCGFLTALFTATSATCVTGLTLADTFVQWNGFGQIVILGLIEIGGLGFMSAASLLVFLLRRKVNMRQKLVIAESIGSDNIGDAVRLQKRILIICFLVQFTGALILFLRWLPQHGVWVSAKLGIFHSISAFCNAGFDILGFETPGGSLVRYASDPIICLTICGLIVIGGIGYLVWDEILRIHQPRKWSVYTKLALLTTAALIFGGMGIYCLLEWTNPDTFGPMSVPEKLFSALFQSVTTRTAGFAGVDQGLLHDGSKALTMFLMLVGGSSGSTAGGLKTVTLVVILLFLWSKMRSKEHIEVFHRNISHKDALNALTIFVIMIGLSFAGAIVLCTTADVSFTDSLYETISAISTSGLSTGITASLSIPAKILLIIYMYFGRVGIMTLALGFLQKKKIEQKYKYADTNLLIG